MRTHTIRGHDNVALHVVEHGSATAPAILLVHGFAQCHLCWQLQYADARLQEFRLVAFDLRGHGSSDKPQTPQSYVDGAALAEDIWCVIEALDLQRPVLAAWSYAGLIACDYLRHVGTTNLSGLALIAARSKVGTAAARQMSGSLFLSLVPGLVARDADARVAAITAFLHELTVSPLPLTDFYQMLGYNISVPPHVCAALLGRQADNDDVLSTLDIPTWIVHGDADTSILPVMAEHHAKIIPNAKLSIYTNVGHAPFYERSDLFNRELYEFAMLCCADEQTTETT